MAPALPIRFRVIGFWTVLFYVWYTAGWWVEALSRTGITE